MTHPLSEARTTGLKRVLGSLLHDNSAASAVFFAVTLSGLVGMVGMGVETGLWFSERRQYQTAADAGAIAGALEMARQMTNGATASLDTTQTGAAWKEAVRNGASTFAAGTSVQQLASPTRAHVEVVEQKSTLLVALSSLPTVTINALAEATVETLGHPCIIALGTSGTVINIQGSAKIIAPNCILNSNSTSTGTSTANGNNQASVTIQGGSNTEVTVAQIYSQGTVIQGGTPEVAAPMSSSGSAASDPFSSVPNPSDVPTTQTCGTVPAGAGATAVAIPAGFLCKNTGSSKTPSLGSVSLSGTNTWTLSGTYYVVDGDFSVGSGATVKTLPGDSATIVMLGTNSTKIGRFNLDSNSIIDLTAPTSGTYKGIVFYQDPNAPATTNANTTNFIGGANTKFLGSIYTPAETVTFGGNSGSSCTLIVAKVINLAGNSNLDTSGCTNFVNLPTYYTVALTQ